MPSTGKITQVIGSTFDAQFPEDQLPGIYNAIRVHLRPSAVPPSPLLCASVSLWQILDFSNALALFSGKVVKEG